MRNGISNHQPHDCLLNRLFKAQIKENIKASRHWPLCGDFTGEFPAQMASNTENVSIRWRHHGILWLVWTVDQAGHPTLLASTVWWNFSFCPLPMELEGDILMTLSIHLSIHSSLHTPLHNYLRGSLCKSCQIIKDAEWLKICCV